jgi:hypothetical protein
MNPRGSKAPGAPGRNDQGGVGRPADAISVSTQVDGGTCNDGGRLTTLQRHAGRAMARRLLDGVGMAEHRLRTCGYAMGAGRSFRQGSDGKVRSVGIERCGNGRACPVCGPAVGAVRAAETGAAVWRWMTSAPGRCAIFVSLAASHRTTDQLEDLHDQLMTARSAVMRSDCETWRRFRRRFGIVDLAWKVEHSCGENGPHPGLHAILLVDRWWDANDAQAAEAWLLVRFRAELEAAGFTGRLSATNGIDLRPVDDPAGVGRYLTKWGIGAELAGESAKLGRNVSSVPYTAIPSVLAHDIGRRDPYGETCRRDPYVRRLVRGWGAYVRLATSDQRKWYRGFRQLKDLVPELRDATTDRERIALCTAALPEELRPERHDDAEQGDDSEATDAPALDIDGDAWREALRAWWSPTRLPWAWTQRRAQWVGTTSAPPIPLELAVAWLAEDEGIAAAAQIVADLAGATITVDDLGFTLTMDAR